MRSQKSKIVWGVVSNMYLLELCLLHASIRDALCPVLAQTYLMMVIIRGSNLPLGRLRGGLQVVGVLGGIFDKTLYIMSNKDDRRMFLHVIKTKY